MINEEIKNIVESGKDIQKQAIDLQKIGKLVCDALNNTAFKNAYEEFTEGLKEKIETFKNSTAQIENEIKENETLIKQNEKLEKDYAELKEKQKQLVELKEKNRILNLPENEPSNINDDITRFTGKNEDLITKHIATLQRLTEVLAEANTDLEKLLFSKIEVAEKNLATIQINQNTALTKLDSTPIESKFSEFTIEVNRLITDYNFRVEKIRTVKSDFEQINLKHKDVMEIFKAHHLENENIFGALKNREGVLMHVQNISNEISDRLVQYDQEIKTLIEKRDLLPIYQLEEIKKYQ